MQDVTITASAFFGDCLPNISVVGRITISQKCPHPNPWNLCICYIRQREIKVADGAEAAN